MSGTIYDYLCRLIEYNSSIIYIKKIIFRACYTGYLSDAVNILIKSKFKDEILKEILKTHEKINNLIESFNKNTNYKYKEMFEDRNNYCNKKNCHLCEECGSVILSCINFQKYMDLDTTNLEGNAYDELIRCIINELTNFIDLKLT